MARNFLTDPNSPWAGLPTMAQVAKNYLLQSLGNFGATQARSLDAVAPRIQGVPPMTQYFGLPPAPAVKPEDAMMNMLNFGPGSVAGTVGKAGTKGWANLLPRLTSKVIERIHPNEKGISISQIEQEMARQDVSDPERKVLRNALSIAAKPSYQLHHAPPGKIAPEDLARQFERATERFRLYPMETEMNATYGLNNINREAYGEEDLDNMFEDLERDLDQGRISEQEYNDRYKELEEMSGDPDEIKPISRTYMMPFEIDQSNHFGDDPNLYGWARSFTEDNVPHVIEIQSDLGQHLKPLSQEKRTQTEALLKDAEKLRDRLGKLHTMLTRNLPENQEAIQKEFKTLKIKVRPNFDANMALSVAIQNNLMRMRDLHAALQNSEHADKFGDLFKNWERRIAQQEMGQAAKKGQTRIRFATPETVAQVEDWGADTHPSLKDEIDNLKHDYQEHRISHSDFDKKFNELWRRNLQFGSVLKPEFQGLHRRYQDLERYLKSLGGKRVTDRYGHTWVEVPVSKGYVPRLWGAGAGGLTVNELAKNKKKKEPKNHLVKEVNRGQ